MKNYIYIYNNLIKLTRNKNLYFNINTQESFSTRLILFLLHFAFFLKSYKNTNSKQELQDIYDFNFRQLEISIREIGYGDVSINKKMKDYLNLFHKIIETTDKWNDQTYVKKCEFFVEFLGSDINDDFFVDYFNKFIVLLEKNTLNSFNKDIIEF